ncbi:hypothetical protein [Thermoplasma sp.]|uniref:hypothetical protein n=1 Tax=Thermoplasma sp. TaxID=1973142 RepID=UPI00127002F6|nr:hypothetical protein [Thermoplasma sp.]KAA8921848.1 MAG: hypothetical protein F6Q11_07440 [Thermoplasma sp.]
MSVPSNANGVTIVIQLTNTNSTDITNFISSMQSVIKQYVPADATLTNFIAQYSAPQTETRNIMVGQDSL